MDCIPFYAYCVPCRKVLTDNAISQQGTKKKGSTFGRYLHKQYTSHRPLQNDMDISKSSTPAEVGLPVACLFKNYPTEPQPSQVKMGSRWTRISLLHITMLWERMCCRVMNTFEEFYWSIAFNSKPKSLLSLQPTNFGPSNQHPGDEISSDKEQTRNYQLAFLISFTTTQSTMVRGVHRGWNHTTLTAERIEHWQLLAPNGW